MVVICWEGGWEWGRGGFVAEEEEEGEGGGEVGEELSV